MYSQMSEYYFITSTKDVTLKTNHSVWVLHGRRNEAADDSERLGLEARRPT